MQTPPRHHLQVKDSARHKQNVVTWRKHKRGFKEIPLSWVGHQCGKQRYPRRDAQNNILPKVPPLNAWRNNLTGLSQYFNLYIVACNDSIQVYNPRFPEQWLSNEPLLKWKLPVSAPYLRGHMPAQPGIPTSAHSINNLLISDLGDIEIMVCACDDGDVLVYHTNSLLGPTKPRPLFHYNVGRSAWGLAVHKEARLIAVSANTHEITVFAPALVTTGPGPHNTSFPKITKPLHTQLAERNSDCKLLNTAPDSDKLDHFPSQSPRPDSPLIYYRHTDKTIRLKYHVNNIPSISFCNTYDDRNGTFLASTDICGTIVIWDVLKEKPIHIISYRPSMPDQPMFDHYDMSRSGWGLLFLDRKCFGLTKSIVEAMGVCNKISLWIRPNQHFPSVQVYDISHSRSKVQKASPHWILNWHSTTNSAQPFPVPVDPSFDENEQDALSVSLDISSEDESEQVGDGSSDWDATPTGNDPISPRSDRGPLPGQQENSLYHNSQGRIPEDRIGTETAFGMAGIRKWPMLSTSINSNDSEIVLPSVPLLFLQPHNVHLFQSASMEWYNVRDHQPPSPLVMLHDPLEQSVPNDIRGDLAQCDRLNLYTQIPDLGVVLVGSPKGRVAVLSLHLLEPDLEPLTGHPRTDIDNPLYTMRLDYILPFAREETEGKRPLQQLVGLAAGPIHGEQNLKQLRYRIMLTYQDHSVLSYEIGREGSDSYRDVKMY